MTQTAPEGYTPQTCEITNTTILVPTDWIFWSNQRGMINERFAVREKLEYNDEYLFEVGFTLAALRDVSRRSKYTAADLARKHVEHPPVEEGFMPASNLEIIEQGPRTIFHRRYITENGVVMGLNLGPRSYHLGGICAEGNDTAYLATFEAPTSEWDTYKSIAQVMIESIEVQ